MEDPSRFHLIAPYNDNPNRWLRIRWTDIYSRRRYGITTGSVGATSTLVRVKTYGDVLSDYRTHPESKFDGPDDSVCGPATRGVLQRRAVSERPDLVTYIGKESNHLETREADLEHDPSRFLNEYADPRRDQWFTLILPILKKMPRAELAQIAGVSEREIQRIRNGRVGKPRLETQQALIRRVATDVRLAL